MNENNGNPMNIINQPKKEIPKSQNSLPNKRTTNGNVIKFKTTFRNTVYDVMINRGWKESDEDWNFYWADREYVYELLEKARLDGNKKVNHFRNGRELCRKDGLSRNLKRMKKKLEKENNHEEAAAYDFYPTSFLLPSEYPVFAEEFKRNPGVWIMKPAARSQGKGIFLFTKLSQVEEWKLMPLEKEAPKVENYVVQKYIKNPYLVGGRKFDLRIYALVTSFMPLEVYLYRDGFARFTNEAYSIDPKEISNTYIHLTNVAIQKTSRKYNKRNGGKWNLRQLKQYFMYRHGVEKIDNLFYNIQMIIIRSLLSVQNNIVHDKHCFEVYGYDLMIDSNLKPFLIEVNASPSLSANTAEDYQLKCGMLSDMLDILDLEKRNLSVPSRVGGYDLIYRNGAVIKHEGCVYSTFLGCDVKDTKTDRSHHSSVISAVT